MHIHPIKNDQLTPALDLVEHVFTDHESAAEGALVRRLVEEIRAKKYYLPELELVAETDDGLLTGYAMFSRFHIDGRFENELLMLTPVAVRPEFQRQHISRDLLEFGFDRAKALGFTAVLVEGDPKNYTARGFLPSYRFGVEAGERLRLPHPDCLMFKELTPGAAAKMRGHVDYSFYDTLR